MPSSFGQYRIDSRLGDGRFTETYHAHDLIRRRPVALKLLKPGLLSTEKDYREFLNYIQRAAELVHPRIAWVWETGSAEGRYYFTERFVAGEALSTHIARLGPLPWDRTLQTVEQVAQAIEFAEERGWFHGRVTPHNILLGADLGAILSDYGLAQAIRQLLPVEPPALEAAVYLPPEVLQGHPVSPRADQYMLACSVVEMLSGKPPFTVSDLEEIRFQKSTAFDASLLPLELVPPQASEMIERALNPDPSARFDNSLDFVQSFEHAIKFGLTDASARLKHQEQLRRWRETAELARLEAEEAARLENLEQARHEIQERARQEAEQAILLQEQPISPPGLVPSTAPRRRVVQTQRRRYLWLFIAGGVLILLLLTGYWVNERRSSSAGIQPSATTALNVLPATNTPATPPSETISPSPSHTLTLAPTSRPSITPSRTASPSMSPTPTASPSPITVRTATPDRSDRN